MTDEQKKFLKELVMYDKYTIPNSFIKHTKDVFPEAFEPEEFSREDMKHFLKYCEGHCWSSNATSEDKLNKFISERSKNENRS